jgi:hypothetical protein
VLWADARGRVFLATLAVPAPPERFAVLGNPQRGQLSFGIPAHAGEASLELFDVSGRRVAARSLGARDAGPVSWTPTGRLPAGLYFVRFRSAAQEVRSRLLFLP